MPAQVIADAMVGALTPNIGHSYSSGMSVARQKYLASVLLLVAWLLDWLGMHLGASNPNLAVLIVAGLLLFGVWRGVRWCRTLILYLAAGASGAAAAASAGPGRLLAGITGRR